MPLYEHTEGGKVDERVRTVPATYNDVELAAKAADRQSGWKLAGDTTEQPQGEQAPPSAGEQGKAPKVGEVK